MKGAKRNSSDSIRLPRTDLKTLLGEKGNVVITTGTATEIPGSNVARSFEVRELSAIMATQECQDEQ